jgi:hypothetical protein
VLIRPLPAKPHRNYPGHSENESLFREVEQRYVIKFFVEKGMKGVKIIDRLNKHYRGDALQRKQVYNWIKEMKSKRRDLSNIQPLERVPDEGLDDCNAKALTEDPHL